MLKKAWKKGINIVKENILDFELVELISQ